MPDQPNDAADPRQNEPRRGLEGKGYDAGTGYGGAGNSSLFNAEGSYGGQSGAGGSSLSGAYQGEGYGRLSDDDGRTDQGDQSLRGGMRAGTGATADDASSTADLSSNAGAESGAEGGPDADANVRDLDEMPGATRREPGR